MLKAASGDIGIETKHLQASKTKWLWSEDEEGTNHPQQAALQENEARQGVKMKDRMGDGCLLLCFGTGRPEQRTEGEIHIEEMAGSVVRNENQGLASPLEAGRESPTCLKTLNLCPRMELSRLGTSKLRPKECSVQTSEAFGLQ